MKIISTRLNQNTFFSNCYVVEYHLDFYKQLINNLRKFLSGKNSNRSFLIQIEAIIFHQLKNNKMGALNTSTQQSDDHSDSLLHQWQVVSDSKSTKYVNKISQDEFVLKMIDYSAKAEKQFKMRQFYTFEHNPRVVVLVQNSSFIQLLVQDAPTTLKKWISQRHLSQSELLMMIRTVIEGFKNFQKKYGSFYITEKMIRVNKKGRIVLWINEKFQSNKIEYKLPSEDGQETMLLQILKLFATHIQGLEFEFYPTFEKSISYIHKIFISNSLRETQCTDWKKRTSNRISTFHHSRRLTDQFKNSQTMHSFPITTQILRDTQQSRESSQYGSKKSYKNTQKVKKHRRFHSNATTNIGPFLTEFNTSDIVESVEGSEKSYQHQRKHKKSNTFSNGIKKNQCDFQIHLKSTLEEHAKSFEMRKKDKVPIMETINQVSISRSNISRSDVDSPSLGLRLKKSDSRQEISSPEIRKIRAQLNNLL